MVRCSRHDLAASWERGGSLGPAPFNEVLSLGLQGSSRDLRPSEVAALHSSPHVAVVVDGVIPDLVLPTRRSARDAAYGLVLCTSVLDVLLIVLLRFLGHRLRLFLRAVEPELTDGEYHRD